MSLPIDPPLIQAGPSRQIPPAPKDFRLKTKTGVACSRCRRRRAKCDGRKPRCSRCVAEDKDGVCVYALSEDGRKPPSRALVQALRARIVELESQLALRPSPPRRDPEVDSSDHEHLINHPSSSSLSPDYSTKDADEPEGQTPADLLAFRMESQLLITDKGQARIFGPTSPFLYDCAPPSESSPRNAPPKPLSKASASTPSSLVTPILNLDTVALAPTWFLPYQLTADLHLTLLRTALTWAASFQEWVELPAFLRDMVAGDDGESSGWSPVLHLAVLALGAHYLHGEPAHQDVDAQQLAHTFMLAAKQRLILFEMESPGLATIRGIMLVASMINAKGDDRQAWLLLGMATRMSEDSGLHLNPQHLVETGAMSRKAAVARNRTFWSFFIVDQFWSIWLGRPSLNIWGDSVSLPEIVAEDDYSIWYPPGRQPELSFRCSSFRELSRLVVILQKTMHSIFCDKGLSSRKPESRATLDVQLFEWMTNLPAHLRINGSPVINPPHVLLLHAIWHSVVIVLHRPCFMDEGCGPSSKERCISAAKAIVGINRQYDTAFGLARPIQTMSLTTYLAGTVFLMMLSADLDNAATSRLLSRSIDDLEAVGVTWPDAARCGKVLRNLQSSWCLEPDSGAGLPPLDECSGLLYNQLLQFDIDNLF